MAKIKTSLQLNKLELAVHLGWTKQERKTPQLVLLDISIAFPRPPQACQTDKLADSICYKELTDNLRAQLKHQHFALIEYLAREIHQFIKKSLPKKAKLCVSLTKFPAIKNLHDGVCFCYEDE